MDIFSQLETEMNFQIFLQQQEQRWKLHVRESMSALIDLCKQTILNAKAICVMAADILDMSKRTPSCVGDETLDMSTYLSPAISQLAKTDIKNLPVINKHVNVIVEYLEV